MFHGAAVSGKPPKETAGGVERANILAGGANPTYDAVSRYGLEAR